MLSKTVVVAADPGFENDQRLVKAALDAIAKTLPITFEIQQATPEKASSLSAEWLIWLSNKKLPVANASSDSIKIISYQLKPSTHLLEPVADNRCDFQQTPDLGNGATGKPDLTTRFPAD